MSESRCSINCSPIELEFTDAGFADALNVLLDARREVFDEVTEERGFVLPCTLEPERWYQERILRRYQQLRGDLEETARHESVTQPSYPVKRETNE